jgi:hypothetical protein
MDRIKGAMYWLIPALAVLGFLGATNLRNGITQFDDATTPLERAANLLEFISGILGLGTGVAAFTWRRWADRLAVAWAIAISLTAGFAAAGWGRAGLLAGLAAFLGAAAFSALIVWMVRKAVTARWS